MKKAALSVTLFLVVLALAMFTGCSATPQDNAMPPRLEPLVGASDITVAADGENLAHRAYVAAFQEANERWPWAERDGKAKYASLAMDYAEAYLSGDEDWYSGRPALMEDIVAELDQSQAEILALRESGVDSPRLGAYNLGHAEVGGGPNADD